MEKKSLEIYIDMELEALKGFIEHMTPKYIRNEIKDVLIFEIEKIEKNIKKLNKRPDDG